MQKKKKTLKFLKQTKCVKYNNYYFNKDDLNRTHFYQI